MTNNYFFPRGGFDEITCGFSFPVLIVNIDNCHASETRQEKEPQEVNDQQKRNASIYCLCPRCRAMFSIRRSFPSPVLTLTSSTKMTAHFVKPEPVTTIRLSPDHPAAKAMEDIMDDKRIVGDYEITQSAQIGFEEIVLGYNPDDEQLPYMTGNCIQNPLFISCKDCVAGDDYLEILNTFAKKIMEAVQRLEQNLSAEKAAVEDWHPLDARKCLDTDGCHLVIPSDELYQRVIIVKPEVLKPEYQLPTRQLYLCTGGFGAYPNSRGSACFCTNLFTGRHTRFERGDILATLEVRAVPKWAQENLRKAYVAEQKNAKEREASR